MTPIAQILLVFKLLSVLVKNGGCPRALIQKETVGILLWENVLLDGLNTTVFSISRWE